MFCSVCFNDIDKESFIPSDCFRKYGYSGHKICKYCWWNKFAIEGLKHICPGCTNNIQINKKKKIKKNIK